MRLLLLVSFIWAFSFGLIKGNLTDLNPNFVATVRLGLSLLIFLPFFRPRDIPLKTALTLIGIGMIQYGLMYITYITSYHYLDAYQVALFTIFTPFYVTLIYDVLSRRFHPVHFLSALLAVIGTTVIVLRGITIQNTQTGFILLQISNISFALGQVAYKQLLKAKTTLSDRQIFAFLYLGGVFLTFIYWLMQTGGTIPHLTARHISTLVYLGIIASGVCFFLWNKAARTANTGTLAIMNNLKVPLAVICSIVFFHETTNIPRLLIGLAIIISALGINSCAGPAKK